MRLQIPGFAAESSRYKALSYYHTAGSLDFDGRMQPPSILASQFGGLFDVINCPGSSGPPDAWRSTDLD